jgi:hypothetical protein
MNTKAYLARMSSPCPIPFQVSGMSDRTRTEPSVALSEIHSGEGKDVRQAEELEVEHRQNYD